MGMDSTVLSFTGIGKPAGLHFIQHKVEAAAVLLGGKGKHFPFPLVGCSSLNRSTCFFTNLRAAKRCSAPLRYWGCDLAYYQVPDLPSTFHPL